MNLKSFSNACLPYSKPRFVVPLTAGVAFRITLSQGSVSVLYSVRTAKLLQKGSIKPSPMLMQTAPKRSRRSILASASVESELGQSPLLIEGHVTGLLREDRVHRLHFVSDSLDLSNLRMIGNELELVGVKDTDVASLRDRTTEAGTVESVA
jgi:hypothetical protein